MLKKYKVRGRKETKRKAIPRRKAEIREHATLISECRDRITVLIGLQDFEGAARIRELREALENVAVAKRNLSQSEVFVVNSFLSVMVPL